MEPAAFCEPTQYQLHSMVPHLVIDLFHFAGVQPWQQGVVDISSAQWKDLKHFSCPTKIGLHKEKKIIRFQNLTYCLVVADIYQKSPNKTDFERWQQKQKQNISPSTSSNSSRGPAFRKDQDTARGACDNHDKASSGDGDSPPGPLEVAKGSICWDSFLVDCVTFQTFSWEKIVRVQCVLFR